MKAQKVEVTCSNSHHLLCSLPLGKGGPFATRDTFSSTPFCSHLCVGISSLHFPWKTPRPPGGQSEQTESPLVPGTGGGPRPQDSRNFILPSRQQVSFLPLFPFLLQLAHGDVPYSYLVLVWGNFVSSQWKYMLYPMTLLVKLMLYSPNLSNEIIAF